VALQTRSLVIFYLLALSIMCGMLGVCAIASWLTAPGRIQAIVTGPPHLGTSASDLDFGYALPMSHVQTLTVQNMSAEGALVTLEIDGFPSGIDVVYFAAIPIPAVRGDAVLLHPT
jgi:hypothetical protein